MENLPYYKHIQVNLESLIILMFNYTFCYYDFSIYRFKTYAFKFENSALLPIWKVTGTYCK
jgi:hypothetical protein